MKLNVITLFSGYDSQCLALDRLKRHNPQFDYDLVAWAEIDPHAIKAHNALFPQWAARNLGDVSKVDWQAQAAALGCKIDLLTYSSPCQDFSQAGLQRGGEKGSGTRSSLLWECERAIETLRPKYLLMENVAALVTQKFLPLFNRWQGVLEKLGYANYAQVLNSKNYGVPQNRERIFLVSVRSDCKPSPYYFPKPFPLDSRLKDVLEEDVDDSFYLSDATVHKFIEHCDRKQLEGCGFKFEPSTPPHNGIAKAITSRSGTRETDNYLAE